MNKIKVSEVFKEAWAITRSGLQPILGAAALTFGIMLIAAMVSVEVFANLRDLDLSVDEQLQEAAQGIEFILLMILAPFEGALAFMGWRRATNQPVQFRMIFSGWAVAIPLVLISLVSSVLAQLGLVLFVLPGLYLMAVLSQANLYYLLKGGSPIQAMLASAKVVHRNLLVVIPIYVLIIVLLAVSAIPLGLGLFVTVPLFFHVKGVLFRELFPEFSSVIEAPEKEQEPLSDSGHFEA